MRNRPLVGAPSPLAPFHQTPLVILLALVLLHAGAPGAAPALARAAATSGTVYATPHDSYSSSVGVLGCKINTDRVAYWPGAVSCDDVCISLTHAGRTLHLLRVDSSAGAHDVSYDAWNYLYTGHGAAERPAAGGGVAMRWARADAAACADLIHTEGGRLPLSAANSMGFLSACLGRGDGNWVAAHYRLYNVLDPVCAWGHDEPCELDWPAANQASCPHTLGDPVELTTAPVYNIRYPSGERVLASTGEVVEDSAVVGVPARAARWALVVASSLVGGYLIPWL